VTFHALIFDESRAQSAGLPEARAAIGKARLVWIDAEGRSPEVLLWFRRRGWME